MVKFIFICFFLKFLDASSFDEWIKVNEALLNQKIKSVSFEIIIDNNRDQVRGGKIVIGDDNQFRFEMGSRIVVSDGKSWKSYDNLTNQIFIQDRDLRFEKLLFSWSKLKKIKSLNIKEQANGSYKIKFPGRNNNVHAYFDSDSFTLDSILISGQSGFNSNIFNISISKVNFLNLDIGSSSSEYFDFR